MKFGIGLGSGKVIAILNLLSGELREVRHFPFELAESGNANWKLSGRDPTVGCFIKKDGGKYFLAPLDEASTGQLFLNDEPFTQATELRDNEIHSLKIAANLFAIGRMEKPKAWAAGVQTAKWEVFNGHTGVVLGTPSLDQIGGLITEMKQRAVDFLARPMGLETVGFWLGNLAEWVAIESDTAPIADPPPISVPTESPIPKENLEGGVGEFTCPVCWLKFDGKKIKRIAVHQNLIGDEKLGQDAMLRFIPTEFDSQGDPLDMLGQLSPDTACPHCHHRLPVGFTEMKMNILSIVGAPSSGKSYYLAILIKKLKVSLYKAFKIAFADQDPEYNIQLNAVTNQLFGAPNPAEGAIQKTQMRGDNYVKVHRGGKEVDLPKPYFYVSSRIEVEGSEKSFVFFDNAGEHFLPQNATADDFHIEHVARAEALFFLFDPVSNVEFKRRLRDVESPQLTLPEYEPDNQDGILSQMNVKIKRVLGKPFAEKLDVPLAILINKCDLWHSLMEDWDQLRDPLEKNCFNLEILDQNSNRVRRFMEEINPSIVATAESISNDVRYFPISSFGHKPPSYKDPETGLAMIAPDPMKIDPMMIEAPTIWAIAKISGGLIPVKEAGE